jgi:hypothetical protein
MHRDSGVVCNNIGSAAFRSVTSVVLLRFVPLCFLFFEGLGFDYRAWDL